MDTYFALTHISRKRLLQNTTQGKRVGLFWPVQLFVVVW